MLSPAPLSLNSLFDAAMTTDQLIRAGQVPHAKLISCRAIEAFSQGHTGNTQDIVALLAQCNLDVTGQVSVCKCNPP